MKTTHAKFRLMLTGLMCCAVGGWALIPEKVAAQELGIGSKAPALNIEHWVQDGNGFFKPVTKFENDKVYVVEFWATWCGPCIREIPSVKKTYEEMNAKGFEIIGISLDSDKSKLEDFISKNDMPWPQFFDGKGWKTSLAQEHGISSIPAMWLVDKDGNLVDQNARSDLEAKVMKYLAM